MLGPGGLWENPIPGPWNHAGSATVPPIELGAKDQGRWSHPLTGSPDAVISSEDSR